MQAAVTAMHTTGHSNCDQLSGRMQPHHRHAILFLVTHCAYGVVGGFVFGGLLLWFNVADLWTLILQSEDRFVYLLLLFFGLFVTFGSIGMAVGVMQLGEERD